jgi:chaperonin cofactor prefoldin
MQTKEKEIQGRGWRITFSILGVVLLVLGSTYLVSLIIAIQPAQGAARPDWSSLTNTFSAASSLALIIISIIVALAALVQWPSLKADVRKEIEASQAAQKVTRRAMIMIQRRMEKLSKEMQQRVETLEENTTQAVGKLEETTQEKVKALKIDVQEHFDALIGTIDERTGQTVKEFRARATTIMGFMIGTLHSDPLKQVQEPENRDYLAEAVYLCQKGFNDLREMDGEGKYMALNNLVYYSTLLGVDDNTELLLEQAREIKSYAEKAKHAPPYILTFCRAVATYGSDLNELKEALFLADRISTSDVTAMTKTEATHVVASVKKKIEELASQTTGDRRS